MHRISLIVFAGLLFPLGQVFADNHSQQIADTIYHNGNIHTVDELQSTAQSVAIKDGKFIAVGTDDEVGKYKGKNTELINLGAR